MRALKAGRGRVVVFAGLSFAASFLVAVVGVQAQSVRGTQSPPRPQPLTKQVLGPLSYSATDEGSALTVSADLTQRTGSGMRAYIQSNDQTARRLFQQRSTVEAKVVFTRPLAEGELPVALRAARGAVTAYELRLLGPRGERLTLFGRPEPNAFLRMDKVRGFQEALGRKVGATDLKGFVSVTLAVDAGQFEALRREAEVLLVDVGPEAAVEHLTSTLGARVAGKRISVGYAPTYWYYEDGARP